MRDVNNKEIKGKKDSLLPFKEKINLHDGNDNIPIPKLEKMTKEVQKTKVPSVVVTNPITSIDITQVEKQIITSEAEKLKKEAKRIINEMKDHDSSNNNIEIRKHYKSHHRHRDLESETDEIQHEAIEDSVEEIEEKKHKYRRHRHHH